MRDKPEVEDYSPYSEWIAHAVEVENWTGYDSYRLSVIVSQFTECKWLQVYNNHREEVEAESPSFTPNATMKLYLPNRLPLIRTYRVIYVVQRHVCGIFDSLPPESAHTKLLDHIGYNLINFHPSGRV